VQGDELLQMKIHSEEDQGPQQHRESGRSDWLHRVEMLEVVMRCCHDHTDDEIDQAEQEADESAQSDRPVRLVLRSAREVKLGARTTRWP
jgi:hypothetical protein